MIDCKQKTRRGNRSYVTSFGQIKLIKYPDKHETRRDDRSQGTRWKCPIKKTNLCLNIINFHTPYNLAMKAQKASNKW